MLHEFQNFLLLDQAAIEVTSRRNSTSFLDSRRRLKHRADSDDMITDLPESILGHILSFLPTKSAVATGILSKRWKFLWTTIGNLDFSFNGGPAQVEQFVQSVNYVMLLHKPAGCFNKLSLTWNTESPIPLYVNTWICTAVSRDVHELSICVDQYNLPLYVQSYLFTHEKLKSLELKCGICISPESLVVLLPRLESLKLTSVSFRSEEAFSKLLDGCPVLKHLYVCIDIWNMITCGYIETLQGGAAFKCIISSKSLKHLYLCAYGALSALCSLELDAPSLEYIKSVGMDCIVVKQRLNFLCEADIHLPSFEQESIAPNYCNSLVEAFHALSCAQTLNLSAEVIRALSCATIKMQTGFNRLKALTVLIDPNHWSSIQNFIELSDSLEVLIVAKYKHHYDEEGPFDNSNWTKLSVVPRCLSNSLKTVMFVGYDGDPDELAMVEYIIKHGSVLRIMHICFGDSFGSLNRKHELVQLISTFSRKSGFCEVKLVDGDKALSMVVHHNPLQPSDVTKMSK